MKSSTSHRTAAMIAAGALVLAAGAAVAQPQTPPPVTAPVVGCPHMYGGTSPGMMVGPQSQTMPGGHMMTMEEMQQMHADMRALHEDVAKLRAELEKRDRR